MTISKEYSFGKVEEFLLGNFSSPTHWPHWNMVVSNLYGTDFFYYVATDETDEIIGICPVHIEKKLGIKSLRSGQFRLIPYGGWIFSRPTILFDRFPTKSSLDSFQVFTLPLIEEFGVKQLNCNHFMKSTLIIDLRNSLENIWSESINSKRRNMIRKAEKSNVKVTVDNDIETFYEIYRDSCYRLKLTLQPKSLFNNLFVEQCSLGFEILTAWVAGRVVSNLVIAFDKNYSLYWLGNNTVGVDRLGQGELLQWEAIKRMKLKGCSYYDLCYVDKTRLPQIYEFKAGFSHTEVSIPVMIHKSFALRVMNKLFK